MRFFFHSYIILLSRLDSILSQSNDAEAESLERRPYYDHPTCPRRPELYRKCLKKCLKDKDCKGTRRKCLCDGLCGQSCIRIGMKCRYPEDLMNGNFEMMSLNAFGARVRYSCDDGYNLLGSNESVCQGDGRWSGVAPTCETEGKCLEPPSIENAEPEVTINRKSFPLGTKLIYRCRAGYEGVHRMICVGEGRWVGPKMICSPRRCGHPGEIPNGRKDGLVFVYGSRVDYLCLSGYELVGQPYRVCRADGTWSGTLPLCRPLRCPTPTPLANGHVAGTDFAFGRFIEYGCNRGYKLSGPSKRKCRHDKTWSEEDPFCNIVDCRSLGELYSGVITYSQSTTFNSTATFRCIRESTAGFGDEKSSTCLYNGTWSNNPRPICWQKCKRIVDKIYAATINWKTVEGGVNEWIEHGKTFPLNCTGGYVKERDPVCINGTWSEPIRCVPSQENCSSTRPPELKDGYFRFYSANHNDKAQYMCDSGFQLFGDPSMICVDGEWKRVEDGQKPECHRTECSYPGTIENGKILLVGVKGKFEYGHYVRKIGHNEKVEYQCWPPNDFLRVGPAGATCVNGTWSPPEKPICKRRHHLVIDRFLSRGRKSVEYATDVNRRRLGNVFGNGLK